MAKAKTIWICAECGHNQVKWSGSCSSCHNWNTFAEEVLAPKIERYSATAAHLSASEITKPVLIKDIKTETYKRSSTGFADLDRIMGGGVVPGSLLLLGGEPGIGKSTILLQLSHNMALSGKKVLYVCGEESAEQTSLRAKRLGIESDGLYLYNETQFSKIKMQVETLSPDILIIDSVQIVYKDDLPSSPGSVVQVREVAISCMHIAKKLNITTFLVGHVTKNGDLAGPRVLEHLVDTVFEFEGDRTQGYRLVRSLKNRFGPTDEVAIFQMTQLGLKEVLNPSETFLQEKVKDAPGSVIIPTLEGSRPFLVEVQALVAPSSFATSSRRSSGIDPKRLTLLLAVLEKRMGFPLHKLDVFVSIAGGLKILEPAIDLGVVLAIASSFNDRVIPADVVCVGEVGLGGEVRSVPRIEKRIKEAINRGYKHLFLPKRNLKGVPKSVQSQIQLHGVEFVEDTVRELVNKH